MPGGCAIGTRPVDLLIMALERLGRRDRDRRRLCHRPRPKGLRGRRDRFPKVTVGGTHTALMAASLAERHHRDRERRARAGDRRRRRLPQQDGRQDHRRRHRAHRRRRRAQARRRAPPRAAGPDRDRHLCHGGRHDGRRRDARERAGRAAAERRSTCSARPASRSPPPTRGSRVARNGGGLAPVEVDDRAVPRLPDRPAGAAHGADDARQGHLAHHRDDLREPLHARAGAGAARRAHPVSTARPPPSRASTGSKARR